MSCFVFPSLQRNNGERASEGPCRPGFSRSFYSLLISRDVLRGRGIRKGKSSPRSEGNALGPCGRPSGVVVKWGCEIWEPGSRLFERSAVAVVVRTSRQMFPRGHGSCLFSPHAPPEVPECVFLIVQYHRHRHRLSRLRPTASPPSLEGPDSAGNGIDILRLIWHCCCRCGLIAILY